MAGSERFAFDEVGRLPSPGDNVAIATRRIEAGTRVVYEGSEFTVPHTVLEGHPSPRARTCSRGASPSVKR